MPPKNPLTKKIKKVKLCRECGKSMENEHAAAKTCSECRSPADRSIPEPIAEVENTTTLGEVVDLPDQAPVPTIVTPFFLKKGDIISLNLKQRKFMRIPRSEFSLTPRKWFGNIPDDFDPIQMRMLRIMLESQDIVKGKVYTGIGRDETTLTKAASLLKVGYEDFRAAIGLMVQHTGLVGGYKPHEIFRHLIRQEDDNNHRRPVLNFLQNAMDATGAGPIKATPMINKTIEEVTERKF